MLVVLVVLATYLIGAWVPVRGGNQDLNIIINHQGTDYIELDIVLNGFYSEACIEMGKGFDRITIPEGHSYRDQGNPDVMRIRKLIAIPECDNVSLSINSSNSVTLSDYCVYPVPKLENKIDGNGLCYTQEEFYLDDNAYAISGFLPEFPVLMGEIGYFRGQKFAEVFIYPLAFDGVENSIYFHQDVQIRLDFSCPTGPLFENTGVFNGSASATFINYPPDGTTAIINDRPDREGIVFYVPIVNESQADYLVADYLIIADGSFFAADPLEGSPALNMIAQHRANYNGFCVSVVNVEDICNVFDLGGDHREARAIREFIHRVYMNELAPNMGDDHLGYVLLVGDVVMDNGINGVYTSYDTQCEAQDWNLPSVVTPVPSDHYYSLVSGTDTLADLAIGRFSASNETELYNIVRKTLDYELVYSVDNWRENTLFRWGEIFSDLIVDQQGYTVNTDHFADILYYQPYSSHFHSYLYTNDQQYNNTTNLINQGMMYGLWMSHGFVKTVGDGSYVLEAAPYIQSLSNTHKYPNLYIHACLTGAFDHPVDDCLTETFLNQDHNRGFVTAIGSSRITGGSSLLIPDALYWRYAQSIWNRMLFVSGEAFLTAKNLTNREWDRHLFNFMGDPGLNLMASGFQITQQMAYTQDALITTEIEVMPGAALHLGTETTGSINIRFEQNGRLIVHEGATLHIHNNAQIFMGANNSIDVYGDLIIDEDVGFSGYANEPGDLGVHAGIPNITISGVDFENMRIKASRTNMDFQDCEFENSSLNISGSNTIISLCEFTGTQLIVHSDGNKSFSISITSNEFYNSPVDMESVASFYISGNTFQNLNLFPYPNALNLFHSGWRPNTLHAILSNDIGGESSALYPFANGIYVFNSHADINNNSFKNNQTCITSLNGSSCTVVGNRDATIPSQTQQFMLNVDPYHAIYAEHTSFPYRVSWNYLSSTVFSDEHWMICYDYDHQFCLPHIVSHNSWSNYFIPEDNIDLTKFLITPVWNLQPPNSEMTSVEGLFTEAVTNKEVGNYTMAETQFKCIIETYPEDKFAEAAAKELLPLTALISQNLSALKTYYSNIDVFSETEELLKVASQYKILCDVVDKNYSSAIQAYEDIILNAQSYSDSLYAAIDLCMTYLLMLEDGDKGAVVNYPDLKPVSFVDYLRIRNMLLNIKFEQGPNPEIQSTLTWISAYPNPFNPVVSFDITTPYSFDSELCIYNIKGQLVKKIYCDNLRKGRNTAVWDGRDENNHQVGSGIYLYRMQTPGGSVSGKITLVK